MSSERPGGPADVVPGDADGNPGRPAETPPEAPQPVGPSRRRRRRRQAKKGSLLRELPVLLLVAFVLALVVKTFFVQAFFIPSGSMEQTLHGCPGCTGDRVLVNKVPYWFGRAGARRHRRLQGPGHLDAGGHGRRAGQLVHRRAAVAGPHGGRRPAERGRLRQAGDRRRRADRAVLRRRGPGDRRRRAARRALHLREHPDRVAGLRPGHRARGPAVGHGRPPVGLGGLARRTSTTSTPAPSVSTTSSARRRSSSGRSSRIGLLDSPTSRAPRRARRVPARRSRPVRASALAGAVPIVAWRRRGAAPD